MHEVTLAMDLKNIQKASAIAMDDLREQVDEACGWWQEGGVQATLLLSICPWGIYILSFNVLETKLFTLLLGER